MRTLVVLAGAVLVTTLPAHGQSMLDNFIESQLRPRPPAAAPVERAEVAAISKRARDLRHERRARSDIKRRSRLRNLPTRPSVTPAVATVGAISGSIDAQPMTPFRTVNTVPTQRSRPRPCSRPRFFRPGRCRARYGSSRQSPSQSPRSLPSLAALRAGDGARCGRNVTAETRGVGCVVLGARGAGARDRGAISWIAKRRRADEMLGGIIPWPLRRSITVARCRCVPAFPRALDRSPNWLCAAGHSPNRSRS